MNDNSENKSNEHIDEIHWDWLDDLEYLVKILLLVFCTVAGIFGHKLGISDLIREELILGGSLGTALIKKDKTSKK